MNAKIKNNYFWIIAAIAVVEMLVCGGVANCLNGTFMVPVTEGLGISRGDFALAFSLRGLAGIFVNLCSGVLFIRFGYRKLICVSLAVEAIGLCLMAGSQNMTLLCLGTMLGGTGNLCIIAGNPRLIGSWFHRHHGLVMGVVTSCTGLGGSLFSIILAKIITASGWRYAYLTAAVCYLIVAMLVGLLIRNAPRELGLQPYGVGYIPPRSKGKTDGHWAGFTMAELKKKPTFYLLVLATFLSCTCLYIAFTVAPFVQDCGMSADVAASVQSVMLFGLAATKLGFGFLSDRIGAKVVTLISLGALVLSLFMLAGVSGQTSAYVAVLVYTVALPLAGIAPTLLPLSLFGYQSGAKAMGIVVAMVSAANMAGITLANYLRDAIGSYRPVYRVTGCVAIGVFLLYLGLYAYAAKDRKAYEARHTEEESAV